MAGAGATCLPHSGWMSLFPLPWTRPSAACSWHAKATPLILQAIAPRSADLADQDTLVQQLEGAHKDPRGSRRHGNMNVG